jgi:hypothetical protein
MKSVRHWCSPAPRAVTKPPARCRVQHLLVGGGKPERPLCRYSQHSLRAPVRLANQAPGNAASGKFIQFGPNQVSPSLTSTSAIPMADARNHETRNAHNQLTSTMQPAIMTGIPRGCTRNTAGCSSVVRGSHCSNVSRIVSLRRMNPPTSGRTIRDVLQPGQSSTPGGSCRCRINPSVTSTTAQWTILLIVITHMRISPIRSAQLLDDRKY